MYEKTMSSIVLYPAFYEYIMYNHKIKTSFFSRCLRHLGAKKTNFNLIIVHFIFAESDARNNYYTYFFSSGTTLKITCVGYYTMYIVFIFNLLRLLSYRTETILPFLQPAEI